MATSGHGELPGEAAVVEGAAVADLDKAVGALRHAVVVGDHDAGRVARVNLAQEGGDEREHSNPVLASRGSGAWGNGKVPRAGRRDRSFTTGGESSG